MTTTVFHHGALGDSVLIWPLLRALGRVTLVSGWGKASLAERWVPGVTSVDGEAPDFSRLFTPAAACEVGEKVHRLLHDADRVISFVSDGRDTWGRNVTVMRGRSATLFVPSRPPAGSVEHVTHFHARKLAEQGLCMEPSLTGHRTNPDGPVVIHPGSGGRSKCWPPERFDRLVDHLISIGRPVMVVLGEAERERTDPRWAERWRHKCEVVEPADLIALSTLIARAAVFVGNDSGPTHLAAQLGVSTVALFGPTDPRVWAPVGPAVTVRWPGEAAPMEWLSVEDAAAAVARW